MVHPPSEAERLRALREAELLDTAPDPRFDNITALARDIFGVPVSLISLVDEHRQWFKSNQGLEGVTETERGVAFCDYAIRSTGVFVVEDALQDERFASNPLVTGEPEIRFMRLSNHHGRRLRIRDTVPDRLRITRIHV